LYVCFFWTGIPGIIGLIECFFMPARVREFNAFQAAAIAASLGIPVPGWGQPPMNVPPAGAAPGPGTAGVAASGPVSGVVAEPTPIPLPAPIAVTAAAPAGAVTVCSRCQFANALGAKFCAGCGQAL
ncbi:MAG TPA: hypothetical protein VGG45_18670, partial [Terracidiphilus sp.]